MSSASAQRFQWPWRSTAKRSARSAWSRTTWPVRCSSSRPTARRSTRRRSLGRRGSATSGRSRSCRARLGLHRGREQRAREVRELCRGPHPRGGHVHPSRPASRSSGANVFTASGTGAPGGRQRASVRAAVAATSGAAFRRGRTPASRAPKCPDALIRVQSGVPRAAGGAGCSPSGPGAGSTRQGAARERAGRSWVVDLRRFWPFSNIIARSSWRVRRGVVVSFRVAQVSGHTPRGHGAVTGAKRSRMTRVGPRVSLSSP